MHRIGIISVPFAHQNKKYPDLAANLKQLLAKRGYIFVTNTFEELKEALIECQRRNVTIIGINGGDGTVSHVITAAIRIYGNEHLPLFMPLCGGNFNVLAKNLGIKSRPLRSLQKLIQRIEAHAQIQMKSMRTLEVSGQYGFQFVNGSACRFLEHFYQNKAGPIQSVMFMLQMALSRIVAPEFYQKVVRATHTELVMDGRQVYKQPAITIFCSTMPYMTLGPYLFPETGGADKPFQCVTFDAKPEETFSKAVCDMYVHPGTSPNRSTFCGRSLRIIQDPEDISSYTLDGELYFPEQNEVRINLGPALEFCTI